MSEPMTTPTPEAVEATPITIEDVEQAIEEACESAELGDGFGLERDSAIEMMKDYLAQELASRDERIAMLERARKKLPPVNGETVSVAVILDELLRSAPWPTSDPRWQFIEVWAQKTSKFSTSFLEIA